jgi:predicted hotdog family 3-hydroxylacyl-ACP dehydratase
VALEYMAQCVAAHAGLVARERGEPRPALGLFLGARRTRLGVDSLPAGATLRVRARHAASSSEGLQAFDCTVEAPDAGAALVEARLSLLVPRDLESFLRGARAGARREGES